ncbi:MAG: hypothetical protein QXV69_01645 [Sulfolobaceae archaeon]
MKFRIDKIPKTEKDLEEIENEIHSREEASHHHHAEELLDEILSSLQLLQVKLDEKSKEIEECKKEISRIYRILSKIIIASLSSDNSKKIKSLEEISRILDE